MREQRLSAIAVLCFALLAIEVGFSQSNKATQLAAVETSLAIEPSKEDHRKAFQRDATDFPASVDIDIGEVPAKEITERWVEVKNRSAEDFYAKSMKTDCGCAAGFVENATTKPGDSVRIRLRIRPDVVGKFQRTISILGNEGSNRSIRINIIANARMRFSLNPSAIRIDPKCIEPIRIEIAGVFDKFAKNTEVFSIDGAIVSAEMIDSSPDILTILLTPLPGLVSKLQYSSGDVTFSSFSLSYAEGKRVTLDVPTFLTKPPNIRPSLFSLREDNPHIKFFVVGDFQTSLELLREAEVCLVFDEKDKRPVRADWKNERVCVCACTLPISIFAEKSEKVAGVKLVLRNGDVVDLGEIKLER